VTTAHALAMSGRAEPAARTLATLEALGSPRFTTLRTALLQARAWAAAAAGDPPTARARLEEATDVGEEIGHLVGAANALHGLARLGHARQVAGRLANIAVQVDGELAAARAAYAKGVAARDSQALHAVSEAFEGLGANLYAAEASAEAAAILRRGGRPRHAAACEHRAGQLLSRCEGATSRPAQQTNRR
jgi:hypothetical protein